MKLGLFIRELGSDSLPFSPLRPCAATGAAIVGGASLLGSLLGGLFGKSANDTNVALQRETNEQNRQLVRETNEMQQNQFNENMLWLQKQFGLQRQYALEDRQYNEPRYQVQRLLAAGINPSFAFGQGNMQTSPVSAVGAPSPSSFHTAHMESPSVSPVNYVDGLSEGVGRAVDAYYRNQLVNEQTKKVSFDAQISRAESLTKFASELSKIRESYAKIDNLLADTRVKGAQRDKLESDKKWIDKQAELMIEQWDDLVKKENYNNRFTAAQTRNLTADTVLKEIEAKFRPAVLTAGLRLSRAQESEIYQHIENMVTEAVNNRQYGQILTQDTISKSIENKLKKMNLFEESVKHGIRNGSHGTKTAYYFSDYLGRLIFGGLRDILK